MDDLNNPVLVVIDMQNGFLGMKSEHVIPKVEHVVKLCDRAKIPVVFTRFHNRPNSPYERLIGWKRLRDAPETDITPSLALHAQTVIDKDFYSSFTPEFDQMARDHNWRTFLLCGVATESCVLKTAVDAFERGLRPIVISDACASHAGADIHEAGLVLLSRFIGKSQIKDSDELKEMIVNGNGRPVAAAEA